MPRLALSSWAVHNWIGQSYVYRPGERGPRATLDRVIALPARAKVAEFEALEVCDFHLVPERRELERFREVAEGTGIALFQLLIDQGDITHPTEATRHFDYVAEWIRAARWGGFSRVRVIAGQQAPSLATVERSVEALIRLKAIADEAGVGISTENWQAMMATPEIVHEVVHRSGVGLVFDFGNWNGPDKYERLTAIAPLATSCHAKCDYVDGQPLLDDFETCLRIVRKAGVDGPLTVVHPEPPDEWAALLPQVAAIKRVFGPEALGEE